jgi:hypothetical protein
MTDAGARPAIEALIHEYCFRLDAGDLDGVADLFTDATMTSSMRPDVVLTGRSEVRRNYDGVLLHDDGTPRTLHRITNTTISFTGTTSATARSYFEVLQQASDGPLGPIIAGEYRDRFELVDGAWRFEHRNICPTLIGDLSRHLRPKWIPPRAEPSPGGGS